MAFPGNNDKELGTLGVSAVKNKDVL